jgi:hypothetical protein
VENAADEVGEVERIPGPWAVGRDPAYFPDREFNPEYTLRKGNLSLSGNLVLACEGSDKEIAEKMGFTHGGSYEKQPWALDFMAKTRGTGAGQ